MKHLYCFKDTILVLYHIPVTSRLNDAIFISFLVTKEQ